MALKNSFVASVAYMLRGDRRRRTEIRTALRTKINSMPQLQTGHTNRANVHWHIHETAASEAASLFRYAVRGNETKRPYLYRVNHLQPVMPVGAEGEPPGNNRNGLQHNADIFR
jgi:hypothetical protein